VIADHMNLLQIGLTAKHSSYDPGSLVITDEPISDEGAKHSVPGRDGLNKLPMQYREPYQCQSNGIHNGLCREHRRQEEKRLRAK
jgi:hypothetical protein